MGHVQSIFERTGLNLGDIVVRDILPQNIPRQRLQEGEVKSFSELSEGLMLVGILIGKESPNWKREEFPIDEILRVNCRDCDNRKFYSTDREKWICLTCREI